MKIAIIGSRGFNDYNLMVKRCDFYLSNIKEQIVIVSGGARGADKLAERYAKERNYKMDVYLADWEKHGKRAGMLRNKEMANICDCVVAFWDGESRGTKQMIEYSQSINKKVRIVKF